MFGLSKHRQEKLRKEFYNTVTFDENENNWDREYGVSFSNMGIGLTELPHCCGIQEMYGVTQFGKSSREIAYWFYLFRRMCKTRKLGVIVATQGIYKGKTSNFQKAMRLLKIRPVARGPNVVHDRNNDSELYIINGKV